MLTAARRREMEKRQIGRVKTMLFEIDQNVRLWRLSSSHIVDKEHMVGNSVEKSIRACLRKPRVSGKACLSIGQCLKENEAENKKKE